jgi:succinate dehydrogenase / fumarate reductase membrane anchor subunit
MSHGVWFMAKLMGMLVGADRAVVAEWFKDPVVAILMGVFLVALFTHARLGMQVIIEDYVHNETRKMLLLAINNGIKAACLFAIGLRATFGMAITTT